MMRDYLTAQQKATEEELRVLLAKEFVGQKYCFNTRIRMFFYRWPKVAVDSLKISKFVILFMYVESLYGAVVLFRRHWCGTWKFYNSSHLYINKQYS